MTRTDLVIQRLSRFLRNAILLNSRKCTLVNRPLERELACPHEDVIGRAPHKDQYLVDTYFLAGADMLVTTDGPFHDSVSGVETITVRLRDSFLSDYLEGPS